MAISYEDRIYVLNEFLGIISRIASKKYQK